MSRRWFIRSAQQDALTAARHRAFIAPRLLGSIAALASFPVYLIARGAPSAVELLVFGWLVAPILIAYFLSRTGRYESAHVLSSLALTGLVTAVAVVDRRHLLVRRDLARGRAARSGTFGIAPRRRARIDLCARRRRLAGAARHRDICCRDPIASAHAALAALGIVSAALYATGLALGAEALARTSFWLLYAEEDRYRLLARNMTDVITRHGRDGAVLFVSPAAESLFGSRACGAARAWPVRARPCRRPAGLSDRAGRCRSAWRKAVRSNSACGATASTPPAVRPREFVWIEMRCRPLEQATAAAGARRRREVVAVLRDVTERKEQQQALARRACRGRARQCRQKPLSRHHEPRIAHAAQRHHRLLRHADARRPR